MSLISCQLAKRGKRERARAAYHGLLAAGHVVVRERVGVDEQRPDDDDRCREEHAIQQPPADDGLVFPPGRFSHHGGVHRVNA